jgi:phage terminase small subunit
MNSKQEAFVNEYVKDHNGAQAAIRAGYAKKNARITASKLLTIPNISEAIKERIKDKVMESDEVLTRLADIARGNIAELMHVTTAGYTLELMERDESGELVVKEKTKLIKKIKQKVTTFIAKKESDEDREIVETEIELYSAQEALNTIAKLNGMITDKVDITSKGDKVQPDDRFDRTIDTLSSALNDIINNKNINARDAETSGQTAKT